MEFLLSIPVLIVGLVLQTAIIARLPLLHGTADVMLLIVAAWSLLEKGHSAWLWAVLASLMVSSITAAPPLAVWGSYLLVMVVARLLQRRIWQSPLLTMFVVTFLGTITQHLAVIGLQRFGGAPIGLQESLGQVTLPSALLNLLLALPVYAMVRDLAGWIYPYENEV